MAEKKQSQPKLVKTDVTASVSGKIQVMKYDVASSYFWSVGGTWSIPEDWTEEQAEEFRQEKLTSLRAEIEPLAQAEADELIAARTKNGDRGLT